MKSHLQLNGFIVFRHVFRVYFTFHCMWICKPSSLFQVLHLSTLIFHYFTLYSTFQSHIIFIVYRLFTVTCYSAKIRPLKFSLFDELITLLALVRFEEFQHKTRHKKVSKVTRVFCVVLHCAATWWHMYNRWPAQARLWQAGEGTRDFSFLVVSA